jgi:hypothetical protein
MYYHDLCVCEYGRCIDWIFDLLTQLETTSYKSLVHPQVFSVFNSRILATATLFFTAELSTNWIVLSCLPYKHFVRTE